MRAKPESGMLKPKNKVFSEGHILPFKKNVLKYCVIAKNNMPSFAVSSCDGNAKRLLSVRTIEFPVPIEIGDAGRRCGPGKES